MAACFPLCPGSLAEGTQGAGHCSGGCTLWGLRGRSEDTTTLVSIQRARERERLFPLCSTWSSLMDIPSGICDEWALPEDLATSSSVDGMTLYSISGSLRTQLSGLYLSRGLEDHGLQSIDSHRIDKDHSRRH